MPFMVTLTVKSGERTELPDIHREPTPRLHDDIKLKYEKRTVFARVTGISRNCSRLPGAPVATVDAIEAREK